MSIGDENTTLSVWKGTSHPRQHLRGAKWSRKSLISRPSTDLKVVGGASAGGSDYYSWLSNTRQATLYEPLHDWMRVRASCGTRWLDRSSADSLKQEN